MAKKCVFFNKFVLQTKFFESGDVEFFDTHPHISYHSYEITLDDRDFNWNYFLHCSHKLEECFTFN